MRSNVGSSPPNRRSTLFSVKKNRYLVFYLFVSVVVALQFLVLPWFLSQHHEIIDQVGRPSSPLSQHYSEQQNGKTRQRRQHLVPDRIDGYFNGAPLILRENTHQSSAVHCVGENFLSHSAWKQRSCRFSFLCFNTTAHDFVVFESQEEHMLLRFMMNQDRDTMYASTTLRRTYDLDDGRRFNLSATPRPEQKREHSTQSVSLGGINLKWGKGANGIDRLRWFPKIVPYQNDSDGQSITFYELPESVIFVPFHSLNGANPGHLVWDDFLPIYTLLRMFDLTERELLLMRFVLPTVQDNGIGDERQEQQRGLWASCDVREEKSQACRKMIDKFSPLLLGHDFPYQWSTTQNFSFIPSQLGRSDLVCARSAVAGIGSLTDHGVQKAHGWIIPDDFRITHNHGRGPLLYDFRNFLVSNLGLTIHAIKPRAPFRIVFSEKSSDVPVRNVDFSEHKALVEKYVPNTVVEGYVLRELSLLEQVKLASETAVFVTLCGGGAVTAMFLPKGASVILYYTEDGGIKDNIPLYKPAILDWDLFNAMTHLRVHWMPRNTRGHVVDKMALVMLIRHEVHSIESQTFVESGD